MDREAWGTGTPAAPVRWEPWTPDDVQARLAGLDVPWCVAGGWAVDLFVGRRTREHADLEIALPRSAWPQVRPRLEELRFLVADDGLLWPPGPAALDGTFQLWGLDDRGTARLEVFRERHDGPTWICRRHEGIRRPYAEVVERDGAGVPYLAPEIALLFKAKHARPKDRDDLAAALPLLDAGRRAWLRAGLELVHPGHPWLGLVPPG